MAVTPYHLKLKRVSRREQELLGAVMAYLPEGGLREQVIAGIRAGIAQHLGEAVSLRLEAVHESTYGAFVEKLPRHPLLCLLRIEPFEGRLICEIDSWLAILAVERMLGGEIESMPEPRQLTEAEQGVLEYLFTSLLAGVHEQAGGDARVHLRFDRFAFDTDRLGRLAGDGARAATLVFRATLGRHVGFVRLTFAEPFVNEALLAVEAEEIPRPGDRAWFRKRLERYASFRASLWAEAGRTTLLPADLAHLEEGDVVLLEQGDLRLSGGNAEGSALLRVGQGASGGIDVDVTLSKTRASCRVRGLHKGA